MLRDVGAGLAEGEVDAGHSFAFFALFKCLPEAEFASLLHGARCVGPGRAPGEMLSELSRLHTPVAAVVALQKRYECV